MTYIYKKLDEYDLKDMLIRCDRNNFSLHALRAYIDFVEGLGEYQEFDAIGFICSFYEYDLSNDDEREQFIREYEYLVEDESFNDENSKVESIMDKIKDETLVISSEYNCFLFDYNF